ncbi:MAG: O-antigen ligase family protein [Candidatus Sericytochromatia bacterium]|nr:O-antigen ligase family protein [Candidatus Sericytochromatia bacterium]
MTWSERLSRGLDLGVYALLPVATVAPALYLPRVLADPVRTGGEWAVVVAAWALVVACAGARALRGAVPLAPRGAAAGWLLALGAWVVAVSPLARHPGLHLALGLTLVPVVLATVALGGWIAEAPRRRGAWALACLAALLGVELAMAGLQAVKAPLMGVADAVPREGLLDGLVYAIQAPYGRGVVQGGLGNPNFLAELLVLLVPVTVGAAWAAGSRLVRGAGLALGLAGVWVLVLTSARAAFLGGLVAAALALTVGWLARRRGEGAGPRSGLGWPAALGVGALLALGTVGQPLLAKLAQAGLTDANVASRLGNWAVATSAWATAPVWGVGLGGFAADAPRWLLAAHPAGLSEALSVSQFLEVHNEPLQVLLELGLVGAGLLAAACWRWERGLHGAADQPLAWRVGLLAGVVGLGVASLAGFPGHVAITAWALALVAAVGMGLSARPEAAPALLPGRWAGPYGLAVVLTLAGLGWLGTARGVGAEWWASHELYLMQRLQAREPRAPSIALLGAAAADHARIKERVVPKVLAELGRRRAFDALLATYDRHAAAGLGFDSVLQRGQALQAAGRQAEATPILREVATFYHPATRQHRKAARLLARMGQPDPRAAEADALRRAGGRDEADNQAQGTIGGKRSRRK